MNKYEWLMLRDAVRSSDEYKAWKKAVKENYKGEVFERMQVHHIVPLQQIMINNRITTIEQAKKCKQLWDIKNGALLKMGEHQVAGMLEKIKYPTPDFMRVLKDYIERKDNKTWKEIKQQEKTVAEALKN